MSILKHKINKGTISSWILKYIYSSKLLRTPGLQVSLSFAPILFYFSLNRENKIMEICLSMSSASESIDEK